MSKIYLGMNILMYKRKKGGINLFFRLHSYVYKVGTSNSTLYNSVNNKWYMVDEKCSKILDLCENNVALENIEFDYNIVNHYLKDLCEKGLGTYYNKKVHVDKILPFAPMIVDDKFALINLFVEFAMGCNEKCYYCQNNNPFWQSCRSCVIDDTNSGELNLDLVSDYIDVVRKFRPLNVIIRGGNPFFKNKDVLYNFLNEVNKYILGKITIICNGINITEADLLKLKRYKEKIILNIVYLGICVEDYARVNASPNMFFIQNRLLDDLDDKNISYLISFIMSDRIIESLEDVEDYFIKNRGKRPIICEHFKENEKLLSVDVSRRKLVNTSDEIDFYSRRKYNPCLFGTMSIGVSREITPCPGIKKNIGMLCNDSNCSIDVDLREAYWKLTKNEKNCKNCGLKYMCTDCSALNLDYSQGCSFYDYVMSSDVIEVIGQNNNIAYKNNKDRQ